MSLIVLNDTKHKHMKWNEILPPSYTNDPGSRLRRKERAYDAAGQMSSGLIYFGPGQSYSLHQMNGSAELRRPTN